MATDNYNVNRSYKKNVVLYYSNCRPQMCDIVNSDSECDNENDDSDDQKDGNKGKGNARDERPP